MLETVLGCHAVRRPDGLTSVTRVPHCSADRLGTGKAVCGPLGPRKGDTTKDRVLLKSGQLSEGQDKQFTASQEQIPGAAGERPTSLGARLSSS